MRKKFNSFISVVIPSYNSEKFIGATIDSVLSQTHGNFELIIVDDESTDGTPDIIKSYAEKDERVKFYSVPHSGRPSVPLNRGIDMASGELIAFLDNDDIWNMHKLAEQLEFYNKNTELVFIYSMSVTFGDVSVFSPYYEVLPLLFRAARNRDELIKKGNSVTPSTVLARKDKLIEAGKFDEDPELITHDYDMWLRLGSIGSFGFIPRIHCLYRIHAGQLSRGWELKKERLDYLKEKRGLDLPDYNFFRNKGVLFLIPRNLIHFITFVYVKFLTLFDRIF